jgi:hypothetical protein
MAAAVSEPLTGVGHIDVGRVLERDRALISVGEEEDRGVEGLYFGASRDRREAGQQSAEERAREGNTPFGRLTGRDTMKNGVGLFA